MRANSEAGKIRGLGLATVRGSGEGCKGWGAGRECGLMGQRMCDGLSPGGRLEQVSVATTTVKTQVCNKYEFLVDLIAAF